MGNLILILYLHHNTIFNFESSFNLVYSSEERNHELISRARLCGR